MRKLNILTLRLVSRSSGAQGSSDRTDIQIYMYNMWIYNKNFAFSIGLGLQYNMQFANLNSHKQVR